ncbi:PaaI family thioesterase [Gordonia zhaorongruii]|uniref:PaaI family thioesterase n=1 Tax=Gordonia zhaorongruii TaxID=2597659 RepID=UPI00104B1440|nr:PaaI family thioesterase [Gordonia zhaorongruii]
MDFRLEDIDDAEIERRLSVVEPLTDAVRDLVDAVIRTEMPDEDLHAAQTAIEAVVGTLRTKQRDGGFGVPFTPDMRGMPWGNAVVGARNAVAPPLHIDARDGIAECEMTLGAAYEGPGGCVHGGVASLVLDQMAGEAASTGTTPSFTGTLTVRYLRPTLLGRLRARAEVESVEGRKTFVRAYIADDEGPTVEATAIMIAPRSNPAVRP